MPTSAELQNLIASLVNYLVEDKTAVSITPVQEGRTTLFELRVAEADLGRVIGRQGRTSRSLRAVLAAAARQESGRYQLEIIE